MTQLTMREWLTLTYIQRHMQRWQSAPKLMDIRSGCALGKHEAIQQIRRLQKLGLVNQRMNRVYPLGGVVVGVEP